MTFSGDKLVIGRYCRTSIDVGPALTDKIMRNNWQQVHRSIYIALTPDELVNTDNIKARDEFDTSIKEKLGPAAPAKDFESDPDIFTPTLDWYGNNKEYQTHIPELDEITPETMENYIGAYKMISNGDTVAQGSVRRRKIDMEGNTIGRANSNPILDI